MLKVIGWLALAVFALAALVAALIVIEYYRFSVVSPWLYERTTRAANAANDANWTDGTAWIYTLEARIEAGGETFTATSELTCAPKSFTRPETLKNNREYRRGTGWDGDWLNVWNFKADPLSIHLPDGSRFDFPYDGREACQRLPRNFPPARFSKPLRRHCPLRSRRGGHPAGRALQRVGFERPRRHRREHDLSGLGRVDA